MADPVTKRITGLLRGLSAMYAQWKDQEKDFLIRQIKIILDAIVEEILEDDKQIFATQTAQLMILNFSKLLEFCVNGDLAKLPPELLPIACQIDGINIDNLCPDPAKCVRGPMAHVWNSDCEMNEGWGDLDSQVEEKVGDTSRLALPSGMLTANAE